MSLELTAQQLTELKGAMAAIYKNPLPDYYQTADDAWDQCSTTATPFHFDLGNSPITHLLKRDIEGGEKLFFQEYESLPDRSERVVMNSTLSAATALKNWRRLA
jgi:hypothetical protein